MTVLHADTGKTFKTRREKPRSLLYYRSQGKDDRRPFGIVRRNLNRFVECAFPSPHVYRCSDLSLFSGFQMARTGHRRRAPSGGADFLDNEVLISCIRELKDMFDGVHRRHSPEVVLLRIKGNRRLGIREHRQQQNNRHKENDSFHTYSLQHFLYLRGAT